MLSDKVNLDAPLTPARLADWLTSAQARLHHLAQTPGTSLGHLEIALIQELHHLGVPLLTQAARTQAQTAAFVCPHGHGPLRREAKGRLRHINSVVGSLRVSRDYGWCPQCQEWFYPADARWGLQPNAPASPRLQEMAAAAVLKMPCAQAEESLPRLGACPLSATTLHREARRQGQRALGLQQADQKLTTIPAGVAQLAGQSPPRKKPFVLIIQLDAWNIRERNDWGRTKALRKKGQEPERWHWVYTGTVFRLDQRGHTASQRPVITERGYVATRGGLEAFERLVYAEALRRGLTHAAEVLVLADGAAWIWNLVENRFRFATQRVDLYHVKQHLWAVAGQLYDQDKTQARQWLRPLFRQLEGKSDGAAKVMETLQDLLRAKNQMTPAQREKLAKEVGYFEGQAHRMDYAKGKRRQQPVGSGAIESTCRQYQVRFKRAGQFWSLPGDESLLALENPPPQWPLAVALRPCQTLGPHNLTQLKLNPRKWNAPVANLINRYPQLLEADLGGDKGEKLRPLELAALNNQSEVCDFLISEGANVNAQDYAHLTPLYGAVVNLNTNLMITLLNHGADVRIKDTLHLTVLDVAKEINAPSSVVEILTSAMEKATNKTRS